MPSNIVPSSSPTIPYAASGSFHRHVELVRGEPQFIDRLGDLGDLLGVGDQTVEAHVNHAVFLDVGDVLSVCVPEGTGRQQVVPHGCHAPGHGCCTLCAARVGKRQDHPQMDVCIDGAGQHVRAVGIDDSIGGGSVAGRKERLNYSITAMDSGSRPAGRADQGGIFDS